jgi:hypothetical protein
VEILEVIGKKKFVKLKTTIRKIETDELAITGEALVKAPTLVVD